MTIQKQIKAYKVGHCLSCPFHKGGTDELRCHHSGRDTHIDSHYGSSRIPDWCPLPDALEDEPEQSPKAHAAVLDEVLEVLEAAASEMNDETAHHLKDYENTIIDIQKQGGLKMDVSDKLVRDGLAIQRGVKQAISHVARMKEPEQSPLCTPCQCRTCEQVDVCPVGTIGGESPCLKDGMKPGDTCAHVMTGCRSYIRCSKTEQEDGEDTEMRPINVFKFPRSG